MVKKSTVSQELPEKSIQTEPTEPTVHTEHSEHIVSPSMALKRNQRSGAIFWGTAFIVVGILVLLGNLNIVTVHYANLLQLWPILIIGAGISMLSLRGWLSKLVGLLLAIVFASLAYLVAIDNPYYNPLTTAHAQTTAVNDSISSTATNGLNLALKTGAVNVHIVSSPSQTGYSAELKSNYLRLRQTDSHVADGTQFVTLETNSSSQWWTGFTRINNDLAVELLENAPLAVTIDTGASTVNADFANTQLSSLMLNAGASSLNLRFGTKVAKLDISLEAGASAIRLSVPKDSGVRVETANGLSSAEFQDVNKVSDTVYESNGYSSAAHQITIHTKIGVSSFKLTRY